MNAHELLGIKQEALDNLNVEYDRLLQVLAMVCCGEISPSRVTVDMPKRSWSVVPPDKSVETDQPTTLRMAEE